MTDKEFLKWLYERLISIHGENKHCDYIHKLNAIIKHTPKERTTPNR